MQNGRLTATEGVNTVQAGQIASLQSGQTTLFDLVDHNRTEARRGIAAASALATAPLPSAIGKTSYAANTAYYRGKAAFSIAFAHRLDVGSAFALTAGVSQSGGKDTVARVGVAGEF